MGYEDGGNSCAQSLDSIMYVPSGKSKAIRAAVRWPKVLFGWLLYVGIGYYSIRLVGIAKLSRYHSYCQRCRCRSMWQENDPSHAKHGADHSIHDASWCAKWIRIKRNVYRYLSISVTSCRLSERTGLALLECVVGFAVVPRPSDGALISTITNGGFMMERLSRENAAPAEGAVNLMECMPFPIHYKRVLTRNIFFALYPSYLPQLIRGAYCNTNAFILLLHCSQKVIYCYSSCMIYCRNALCLCW